MPHTCYEKLPTSTRVAIFAAATATTCYRHQVYSVHVQGSVNSRDLTVGATSLPGKLKLTCVGATPLLLVQFTGLINNTQHTRIIYCTVGQSR